jgi:hypothetical protein
MNREELNWLLQTIKDAQTAERFVLAQYERGRISFLMMADVTRERGWINGTANQLLTTPARRNTRRQNYQSLLQLYVVRAMFAEYKKKGTSEPELALRRETNNGYINIG